MPASESREYCVVMPLRPMPVGVWIDRSHWPRHVTVCGNFRSGPDDLDVLAATLRRVAATISPPFAVIGDDAQFGPDGKTPVQLVQSDDLQRVHETLMDALGRAARVDSVIPEHNGPGYRPHVTVVNGGRLDRGPVVELSTLLLVEIGPNGDRSMAVPVATAQVGQAKDSELVQRRAPGGS